MFKWWSTNKKNIDTNSGYERKVIKLEKSLELNITILKNIFNNDETLLFRILENPQNNRLKCCIFFIDGMVDNEIVDRNIIQPILGYQFEYEEKISIDFMQYKLIASNSIEKTSELDKMLESIINGDTLLLMDNSAEALIINSKGWKTRSIEEPITEMVLRGPREGFNESIMTNLTLVRRKLKTTDLKFEFLKVGERSNTKTCICYMEGIANEKIVDELKIRLSKINIDGIFDSGMIQELIKDSPFSPFKTIGSSERPDTIAAKLIEGRIALFVDGTPVVIYLPYVFVEIFHANEDYYINYYFSSISRFLRFLAFFLSVSIPAIYVALVNFHQEIVPTPLIISIAAARQDVPFPTPLEAIIMLLVFEILRETSTRMPSFIGQSLSIVGALVIGQAAVEARFVSAPIVIITALSGITGLMLPRSKGAVIITRFILLVLSSVIGIYGYLFGVSGIIIHLHGMRSFGVPYMSNFMTLQPQDLKDTVIRAPWWYMKRRPKFIGWKNYNRQNSTRNTK